jgi:D-glycero-alpha-D-manno-heptose-7-phosphate kinase
MTITATAPSRIDLAGGTLDIYPLYLLEEGGITVNLGISVRSHVRMETRDDGVIRIVSEDTGATLEAPSLHELPLHTDLDLVARILKFYEPRTGLNVYTRNDAPKGSGLGASSSLLIALSGAVRYINQAATPDMMLPIYGASLEAQNIRIPTGKQDYYSALYGGLNAIWFEVAGDRVDSLSGNQALLDELEQRLLLFFTGETRFSGTSNWNMLKMYIDNAGTTVQNLRAIKQTALEMREAFLAADLDRFAALLDDEWENRKRLADGVTTPQIEALMSAGKANGGIAGRVCGAGGGGCMTMFCRPGAQAAVIEAMEAIGATHMPYAIDREGLVVREVG